MTVLLVLHVLLAAACAALARRWGPRVLALGALAPALSFSWLLAAAPGVLGGAERREEWTWAPTLGLAVPLRLDGLGLLLGLAVTGVGTAVLLYAVHYFAHREHGLGRVAAVLVLFAAAMLALVLADHLLALYVAWELTTVCSFLLIGDDGRSRPERTAALRALLVTTGAGFVLLLGLLLLGDAAGTYRISELLAEAPHGAQAATAAVLVLVGAFAKSAQVPLHPWLPDAMVAPTPVSAYLHAAAMVKAGVYLVARLAPALAELAPWQPLVWTVGVATMLLGGWRALAQTDLKRLLAFGTVAQLGFLVVLLGAGTRTAALAGATLLCAHALFKSALFLVVGVIDHQAGSRDLRELGGVGRSSPALAAVAVLACLSMAGLPPTVGYLGKEAAFEAFTEPGPGHGWVLAGIVAGSALTVAYTLRFLWGAFADRPDASHRMGHAPVSALAPTALLAAAGLALGAVPAAAEALALGHAAPYPAEGQPYHLALWHGLGPPLLLSAATLAAGAAVHLARGPLAAVHGRAPRLLDAQRAEDRLAAAVAVTARGVTAHTQAGSLPTYVTVILAAVLAGPGVALAAGVAAPTEIRWWDTPLQAVVGVSVLIAAAGVVAADRRMAGVLLLSAVGYLVAGLFVVHGAVDLALAQVLVETLTLLVFVLVVRRMPARAGRAPAPLRPLRALVAVAVGVFAAGATLAVGARHVPSQSTEGFFREAPGAGGPNVVNVILTEFRALDTLGEITVLAIAATGVASLVLVSSRMGGPPRPGRAPAPGAPPAPAEKER